MSWLVAVWFAVSVSHWRLAEWSGVCVLAGLVALIVMLVRGAA